MPKRFASSFRHACRGFAHVWRTERNFRIQIILAFAACAVMVWLNFSMIETSIVILCMGAVLTAEMFNTFVENLLDALHPTYDRNVGRAKDIMAGIVLIMSVCAAIVGAIVVYRHIG